MTVALHPAKRIHLPIPDNARCMYCGEVATTWDHVRPLAWGGADHPLNMMLACWPCNLSKGDMPVDLWRLMPAERREWLREEGWIPRTELRRDSWGYATLAGQRFYVPRSGDMWWNPSTGEGCMWRLAIRKATWGPEARRTAVVRRYWW